MQLAGVEFYFLIASNFVVQRMHFCRINAASLETKSHNAENELEFFFFEKCVSQATNTVHTVHTQCCCTTAKRNTQERSEQNFSECINQSWIREKKQLSDFMEMLRFHGILNCCHYYTSINGSIIKVNVDQEFAYIFSLSLSLSVAISGKSLSLFVFFW